MLKSGRLAGAAVVVGAVWLERRPILGAVRFDGEYCARGCCGRAMGSVVEEDIDDMLRALCLMSVLLDVEVEVYAPL